LTNKFYHSSLLTSSFFLNHLLLAIKIWDSHARENNSKLLRVLRSIGLQVMDTILNNRDKIFELDINNKIEFKV
ncbi:hypothetical protein F4774DRAFT_401291, partial [Daldinia eschscholtzii]